MGEVPAAATQAEAVNTAEAAQMTRVSPAARIRMQNVAEREIEKPRSHALWHKHIHNIELDPIQLLKMQEMDEHPKTVDYSCRRTGKTFTGHCWLLEFNARNANQELGIVAPRVDQSVKALQIHLDAIDRSPILQAYIAYKQGRKRLSDTSYTFANNSSANTYGIMSQIDGGDLTAASLDEVDDMPYDRLFSRFMPMLLGARRAGASAQDKNDPQIRLTGVLKGSATLSALLDSKKYHQLPIVDGHLGVELGAIQAAELEDLREQMSVDEYMRQILCRQPEERNAIWTEWVRHAVHLGVAIDHQPAEPMPGEEYRNRGPVFFGYDHTGHGETPEASKSALKVWEIWGDYLVLIYARYWHPGTADSSIREDLHSIWRYFRPTGAMGDAYGVAMIQELCDHLYRDNLTSIDRRTIGDGDSTASTWPEWPFEPIRFEGQTKHQMIKALAAAFNSRRVVLPFVDHVDYRSSAHSQLERDLRLAQMQLTNIKEKPSSKSYSTYQMVKK
ncbi:MAG: hypothetical protein AAF499_12380, partial [Pseudomonadota bacterium]